MKAVSVWVGYLMYLLFAITALSITLYAVNSYLSLSKLKVTLSSLENILLTINKSINDVKTCIECYREVDIKVPPGAVVSLNNSYINGTTLSSVSYIYSSKFVNVNKTKIGNNFWIYKLYIRNNFKGKITVRGEGCIGIEKNSTGVYVSECK